MDEDDEQITSDLASSLPESSDAVAGLPQSVAEGIPDNPFSTDSFDTSQEFLAGQGTEQQAHLSAVQQSEDKISKWLSMFHGPEPKNTEGLRQQVSGGQLSGSDYYAMTGRIYSGGMGDVAQRDSRGNITGYSSPDSGGSPLGGPSGTPGLDAFHAMNPDAPTGMSFSDDPTGPPLPGSVAATVGPPTEGMAMAVDTLHFDRRLQTPTLGTIQGPAADGTRRSVSPNNKAGIAAWSAGQKAADAAIRSNFKAAGLPDPMISASVLNVPGGGTVVQPGNVGSQGTSAGGYAAIPSSIFSGSRRRY